MTMVSGVVGFSSVVWMRIVEKDFESVKEEWGIMNDCGRRCQDHIVALNRIMQGIQSKSHSKSTTPSAVVKNDSLLHFQHGECNRGLRMVRCTILLQGQLPAHPLPPAST